jgi:diaminohydroxyphosphoribosylaminopyrimidine deaminase/5-amino-6-(5-phosphoribosylamino)uracil reductase
MLFMDGNSAKSDSLWMQLAIDEARKGVGLTSPNPAVGAVIVKGGQLLGKGWHTRAGKPHAEREAIAEVLKNHEDAVLKGATIYVTLEPCSTQGRTPACTQGILDAGISRVVYGAEDPNPAHAGAARKLLESAGVEVTVGVEKEACEVLIRAFAKKQRTGLPWVILKSAMSLDGRITRPPGESQWLTSEESRDYVQLLRHESDGIVTGGNTLRIDNPALTIRSKNFTSKPQPWRMVITRGSCDALPNHSQVFTDQFAERTLVQENGDIRASLIELAKRGCNTVLVEAGGTLMTAFIEAEFVDEVVIFYAPLLTGGPHTGFSQLPVDVDLSDPVFCQMGDDILLRALVK